MLTLVFDESQFGSCTSESLVFHLGTAATLLTWISRNFDGICDVQIPTAIWSTALSSGCTLADYLFSSEGMTSIGIDVHTLFLSVMSKASLPECDPIHPLQLDGSSVPCSHGVQTAVSLAFQGSMVGLVAINGATTLTICNYTCNGKKVQLAAVCSQSQVPAFGRWCVETYTLAESQFVDLWPLCFPQLLFHPHVSNQLRVFSTSYSTLRTDLVTHLSALNDGFTAIYEACTRNVSETCSRFKSEFSVDVSMESPNTRRNLSAMKERDVALDRVQFVHKPSSEVRSSIIFRCEWHTKLRPTTDRIHFYPATDPALGGRVLIGIFAKHLTI